MINVVHKWSNNICGGIGQEASKICERKKMSALLRFELSCTYAVYSTRNQGRNWKSISGAKGL